MKKKLIKTFLISLLSTSLLIPFNANAINSNSYVGPVNKVSGVTNTVKKFVFGNGFEYIVKLECSPEMCVHDKKLGKTLYKKTATAVQEFYYTSKRSVDKVPTEIASSSLTVTFTYDKQGYIKIERPHRDIVHSSYKVDGNKWKLRQNHEIFSNDNQCILSQLSVIYKNSPFSRYLKYIDNSHLDIVCSANGDIDFYSKN